MADSDDLRYLSITVKQHGDSFTSVLSYRLMAVSFPLISTASLQLCLIFYDVILFYFILFNLVTLKYLYKIMNDVFKMC